MDIFHCRSVSQNQLPSQTCFLTNAARSCALSWTVVVADVFNGQPVAKFSAPLQYSLTHRIPERIFRSQKLTLGRLQNCVFRQLVLNPSKNWLSTSQNFLTRSFVVCPSLSPSTPAAPSRLHFGYFCFQLRNQFVACVEPTQLHTKTADHRCL